MASHSWRLACAFRKPVFVSALQTALSVVVPLMFHRLLPSLVVLQACHGDLLPVRLHYGPGCATLGAQNSRSMNRILVVQNAVEQAAGAFSSGFFPAHHVALGG